MRMLTLSWDRRKTPRPRITIVSIRDYYILTRKWDLISQLHPLTGDYSQGWENLIYDMISS